MRKRRNQVMDREAVNAVRSFFEANGFIFQEVDLGNDYGKDAYIDFVEDDKVTGFCIALQIKGGRSYRRASGFAIPLDEDHTVIWRTSSVPVAGIVYDPDDKNLYWCNISQYLADHLNTSTGSIPIPASNILDTASLLTDFKTRMQETPARRSIAERLLDICTASQDEQINTIVDSFGIGRFDARVLITLRYLLRLLDGEALRMALQVLAHTVPQPDIFWTNGNSVSEDCQSKVWPHLIWDRSEIHRFLKVIDIEEWDRGQMGQLLYHLLIEDKGVIAKMETVAFYAIDIGDEDVAASALMLVVYWAGERGRTKYRQLVKSRPALRNLDIATVIESSLMDNGSISIW